MNKIIAIYGPTTSNKLGLAYNLSKYVWGKYEIDPEVVNTDPIKAYRGFVVSQSYPNENFKEKVETHLFNSFPPNEEIDLFDFKQAVDERVSEIQSRGNLPILVGGSAMYLLAILQNWQKEEKKHSKNIPDNILIFGLTVSKPVMRRAVEKNVNEMFNQGLYAEFKRLFEQIEEGSVDREILEKVAGYQQFLEMARVSKKSPLDLNKQDLNKIKKWLIKDIVDYGYHQTLNYKKFPGIYKIREFNQARQIVDKFLK